MYEDHRGVDIRLNCLIGHHIADVLRIADDYKLSRWDVAKEYFHRILQELYGNNKIGKWKDGQSK